VEQERKEDDFGNTDQSVGGSDGEAV